MNGVRARGRNDIGDCRNWVSVKDDWLSRVEFPIQLVGRLPHQLWFLPHQLHGLPHQFSIGFGVFRLLNDRVDPKLCCNVRAKGFYDIKTPVFRHNAQKSSASITFCPTNFAKEAPPMLVIEHGLGLDRSRLAHLKPGPLPGVPVSKMSFK